MNVRNFFTPKKSTGIFVSSTNGFNEYTNTVHDTSINGIANHFGYHPDQIYSYCGGWSENSDIIQVVFQVFSSKILFVLTKNSVNQLSQKKVQNFLSAYNVENESLDTYNIEYTLKNGVENKSLSIDFLSQVITIDPTDRNGIHFVPELSQYLFFAAGILVDFQSSDGLNSWAQGWKQTNSQFYLRYENLAKKYWGNEVRKITNEINAQADAYASVENGMLNKYLHLHKGEFDTINFIMLMVCHQERLITESEFLDINHGRFRRVTDDFERLKNGITKYGLGLFTYEFDYDGQFRCSYLNKK